MGLWTKRDMRGKEGGGGVGVDPLNYGAMG